MYVRSLQYGIQVVQIRRHQYGKPFPYEQRCHFLCDSCPVVIYQNIFLHRILHPLPVPDDCTLENLSLLYALLSVKHCQIKSFQDPLYFILLKASEADCQIPAVYGDHRMDGLPISRLVHSIEHHIIQTLAVGKAPLVTALSRIGGG